MLNAQPALALPFNQTNTEWDWVELHLSATDPDGDTLTFAANHLPPGLSVEADTGAISGFIADGAAEVNRGDFLVTLMVDDGHGGSDVGSFTWNVNDYNWPPEIRSPGDQRNAETDVVSWQIDAWDDGAGPLTFTASGLPGGVELDPATGLISGLIAADAATGSDSCIDSQPPEGPAGV